MAEHHHHHSQRGEFLKCLSEFFKRDLVSIPIVKKYPHQSITQRCGLKAATIELDTAAYPSIEYIAGTRLSIYPLNPVAHVNSIMEHLVDDVSPGNTNTNHTNGQPHYSHQVTVNNFAKFAQLTGKDCLRLALTYLFDIMTAPSRELIRLLADNCQLKEQKRKLVAIGLTNESWEKWLCSSHRTLKSLFDEYSSCKLSAGKLLNELNLQQPRQYSISNIKSSKRFRTEIIVVQHKYSLSQIELNLRQLRDRETYEEAFSPPRPSSPTPTLGGGGSRSNRSNKGGASGATNTGQPKSTTSGGGGTSTAAKQAALPSPKTTDTPARSPSRPPQRPVVAAGSRGSKGSQRSIRSTASFANSPITTHQVKRVSSFSGPLMSAYANASSQSTVSSSLDATGPSAATATQERSKSSKLSLLNVLQSHDKALKSNLGGANALAAGKFEGLCSNYLLNLNSSDQILCEFIENPRFTLKGNRERPIMMIGQDVGMIAFRAFLQQRHLEHDRAQVFYNMFKDLSPKKFGDMQLVCLTGHKSHIEELFKREVQVALNSRILSSHMQINRRHFLSLLVAATNKSQQVLSQLQQPTVLGAPKTVSMAASKSSLQPASNAGQQQQNLPISSKELLELGDKIFKLLVKENGCLYTCCDPHMTQAIEILTFESIARNSQQLTRERLMQLLPKWKGSGMTGEKKGSAEDSAAGCFTLENTYERAQIVQEIYDSSI